MLQCNQFGANKMIQNQIWSIMQIYDKYGYVANMQYLAVKVIISMKMSTKIRINLLDQRKNIGGNICLEGHWHNMYIAAFCYWTMVS